MTQLNLEELSRKVKRYLTTEIERGSFPGAVYAIGDREGIVAEDALGYSVVTPAKIRTNLETIYDAASLTKPLITATLALKAAADGRIDLDEPVSNHLHELRKTDKEPLTFVDLLSHRGGFQAWYPLYTQGLGDAAYLDAIVKRPLRYKPGTRAIYSCLGFITLHLTLERLLGRPAEELARELIFKPLGIERACFNPAPERKYEIAATEWGNGNERQMVAERNLTFAHFRNYMIWGETDDGNAYHMGGMAGNSGLFATARDTYTIARSYLREGEGILPSQMVERARRNHTVGFDENRGLGWQLPSSRTEGPASMFSELAFGHTGFTGTSVWVDPERDLIIVLFTNRLHPHAQPVAMQTIRANLHRLVVEEWDRTS